MDTAMRVRLNPCCIKAAFANFLLFFLFNTVPISILSHFLFRSCIAIDQFYILYLVINSL